MKQLINSEFHELETLCKPLLEYLKSKNPYSKIIISQEEIQLVSTEIGIPIKSDKPPN